MKSALLWGLNRAQNKNLKSYKVKTSYGIIRKDYCRIAGK